MSIGAKGRLWVVLLLVILVAAFFVSSWQVNEEARIAPLFISSISLIILLLLLRSEVKNARQAVLAEVTPDQEAEKPMNKETYRKLGVITLWLVATTLLLVWLDYMLVFVLMQFVLTYFISRRPLVQSVVSTLILGAFVYVLFRLVLGIG